MRILDNIFVALVLSAYLSHDKLPTVLAACRTGGSRAHTHRKDMPNTGNMKRESVARQKWPEWNDIEKIKYPSRFIE